jgi:chitodextrinase
MILCGRPRARGMISDVGSAPTVGRGPCMAAGFSAWKVNQQYAVNDRTALNGKHYLCLVAHKSNSANNPKGAVKFWKRYET